LKTTPYPAQSAYFDFFQIANLATVKEERCRQADSPLGRSVCRDVSHLRAKPRWKAPGGLPMIGLSRIEGSVVGGQVIAAEKAPSDHRRIQSRSHRNSSSAARRISLSRAGVSSQDPPRATKRLPASTDEVSSASK